MGRIHQSGPYLHIPLIALQVQISVFQIGFLELLQCTDLAVLAVLQHLVPHTFPEVQLLDGCVCPLVSILSSLVVAQVQCYICQAFWDDSSFKIVAIIYNGSKKNIAFDKVELSIHTLFYLVMKFPNFQVLQ